MAEYRFRPRARQDVEAIWEYTRDTWGHEQARRYLSRLHAVCEELTASPQIGKACDEVFDGLRSFPAGKHLVFYLVTDDGIEVVRVLHQRMDPDVHLA